MSSSSSPSSLQSPRGGGEGGGGGGVFKSKCLWTNVCEIINKFDKAVVLKCCTILKKPTHCPLVQVKCNNKKIYLAGYFELNLFIIIVVVISIYIHSAGAGAGADGGGYISPLLFLFGPTTCLGCLWWETNYLLTNIHTCAVSTAAIAPPPSSTLSLSLSLSPSRVITLSFFSHHLLSQVFKKQKTKENQLQCCHVPNKDLLRHPSHRRICCLVRGLFLSCPK